MDVALPQGSGWSGIHLRGARGAGDTSAVEQADAVIVKRSYRVAGGALQSDGAGEVLTMADALVTVGERAWTTRETDLAIAKAAGDVIVLGARDPQRGGAVRIGGDLWLARSKDAGDDVDLQANLFGWHPRVADPRRSDYRPLTSGAGAGDRLDRAQRAQRRVDGIVATSRVAALPPSAAVSVTQSRIGSETQDRIVLAFAYALPTLSLTLMLAEPGRPDRAAQWCPHVQGPLTLDTLVLRPDAATASAVWRRSWPAVPSPLGAPRRAIVTEGAA